jgi:hypothetical protein
LQLLNELAIIVMTFHHILLRKAKVFAKIRKQKLLFQLYAKRVSLTPMYLTLTRPERQRAAAYLKVDPIVKFYDH